MRASPSFVAVLAVTLLAGHASGAQEHLFAKSYAVVIGIGDYPRRSGFGPLTYPRKDAGGMAAFLRDQGFEVTQLFDEKATRRNILSSLEDEIAPHLGKDDRVLVFYSGHGQTRIIGEKEYGYIIPHDADARPSSWIGMDTLRNLSEKMGRARHILFIMDACYGGQIGLKAIGPGIAADHPQYVRAVAERPARQFLTAGGADQQVLDGGPDGFSYFTGFLLEALELGYADLNGDTYVTASELSAYITPRASTWNQTPATGVLPGHAQGEFLFRVAGQRIASAPGAVDELGRFKGAGAGSAGRDPAEAGDRGRRQSPDAAEGSGSPGSSDAQTAYAEPRQVSLEQAASDLTDAIHADYDRAKRDFYRFLQRHSPQDVDTRRVNDVLVLEVVEVRDEGWVAELDYFVIDISHRGQRKQGRFLVRPRENGVDFLDVY